MEECACVICFLVNFNFDPTVLFQTTFDVRRIEFIFNLFVHLQYLHRAIQKLTANLTTFVAMIFMEDVALTDMSAIHRINA